jgi:hypothetical protein
MAMWLSLERRISVPVLAALISFLIRAAISVRLESFSIIHTHRILIHLSLAGGRDDKITPAPDNPVAPSVNVGVAPEPAT